MLAPTCLACCFCFCIARSRAYTVHIRLNRQQTHATGCLLLSDRSIASRSRLRCPHYVYHRTYPLWGQHASYCWPSLHPANPPRAPTVPTQLPRNSSCNTEAVSSVYKGIPVIPSLTVDGSIMFAGLGRQRWLPHRTQTQRMPNLPCTLTLFARLDFHDPNYHPFGKSLT